MNRVIGGIVLCLLFLSLEVSGNNNNKNVNNNDNNNLNIRPIVGILTQPSSSSLKKYGPNYIAASVSFCFCFLFCFVCFVSFLLFVFPLLSSL